MAKKASQTSLTDTSKTEAIKPKNKKNSITSLREFLYTCPGDKEVFVFETPEEASDFGKKLRELACLEEGVDNEYKLEEFKIDISYQTVRISVNQPSF